MYRQIYNKILSHPILVLAIIQLLIIFFVFHPIIFHPDDFMFTNMYDGLKNYFTYSQFVKQETSPLGPFHFTQMNYPFGEYVFFTDNTPFLALPLRFINTHLFNIESHIIGIHNYFYLFNVLLTPVLFYKIISRYISKPSFIVLLFCIVAGWINPQILKLSAGVYNLSLSFILLTTIIIMQAVYPLFAKGDNVKLLKVCLGVIALILLSASIHLYYIPLIALPLGVFVTILFLHRAISEKQIRFIPLMAILSSILIGGFGFYVFLQSLDSYSSLRSSVAQGFNWSFWRFTPEAIFTPEAYSTIPTPLYSCKIPGEIPYESLGFLGNFFWYSFYVFILSWVYMLVTKQTNFFATGRKLISSPFFLALFITMFVSYTTASGTYVELCVVPISFDNIFSPFYFLKDSIDLITQFRCLGRFSWMGFWIASIFSIVLFVKWRDYFKTKQALLIKMVSLALVVVLVFDLKDAALFQTTVRKQNLFSQATLEKRFAPLNDFYFNEYQAIFTIPAVQVGSENYAITIDDQEYWTEYWMQLSAYSDLPLFNCKMSRTALPQAQAQVDLLFDNTLPPLIEEQLNDKPVLVVYNPEMLENFDLKIEEYAGQAMKNSRELISTFKMDTLLEYDNIYYLRWDIKNKH